MPCDPFFFFFNEHPFEVDEENLWTTDLLILGMPTEQ